MTTFKYAEIDRETNVVRCLGEAPFLPNFGEHAPIYALDVTTADPMPQAGWIYSAATGRFVEPTPEPPAPDPYLGELFLDEASGAEFGAGGRELNATKGRAVTVVGYIVRGGQRLTHIAPGMPLSMPILRLPLIPTDIDGNPIDSAQPSMAVANIDAGIVTASWMPEVTGTYKVTEHGINVRLADGQKLRFGGLDVFVLPDRGE